MYLANFDALVMQADPAQALNVPVVPLGALLTAAYPLSSRSPYVLAWLNQLISAEGMMHPELLEKLVLNNFCKLHTDFAVGMDHEISVFTFKYKSYISGFMFRIMTMLLSIWILLFIQYRIETTIYSPEGMLYASKCKVIAICHVLV